MLQSIDHLPKRILAWIINWCFGFSYRNTRLFVSRKHAQKRTKIQKGLSFMNAPPPCGTPWNFWNFSRKVPIVFCEKKITAKEETCHAIYTGNDISCFYPRITSLIQSLAWLNQNWIRFLLFFLAPDRWRFHQYLCLLFQLNGGIAAYSRRFHLLSDILPYSLFFINVSVKPVFD